MNKSSPFNSLRIYPGPRSRYRRLPVVGTVLDDLLTWFRNRGYAESTLRWKLNATSVLMRWLQRRRGLGLRGLTQQDLSSAYDWYRRRHPYVAGTTRALAVFFREQHLIPEGPRPPISPSERELVAHGAYLREVRGLAKSTIEGHQNRLRFFLGFLGFDQHPSVIRELEPQQIDAFLRKSAKNNNRFSLQHIVASLRSFLQRQHAQGVIKQALHQQINTPRTYRLEKLPQALPWEQVVGLLRSVDRSQPDGQRDFTILYLAARYGLRSGELVRLRLDDINWREGVLLVPQTKTRQTLRLPLTNEAGDILTKYLKSARPRSPFRELFLRRRAPWGLWSTLLCMIFWSIASTTAVWNCRGWAVIHCDIHWPCI